MDFVRCRQVVLFLIAGMLIQTSAASTASISELEAISQAAWQRTLVMRIAKTHMLVAAGID